MTNPFFAWCEANGHQTDKDGWCPCGKLHPDTRSCDHKVDENGTCLCRAIMGFYQMRPLNG